MSAALKTILSHWRHKPLQLFTLVFGIALATALWTGIQAINAEARASYARAANAVSISDFDMFTNKQGETISHETYISLRRNGWQVSPVIEHTITVPDGEIILMAVDPITHPARLLLMDDQGVLRQDALGTSVGFASRQTIRRAGDAFDFELVERPSLPDGIVMVDLSMIFQPDAQSWQYSHLLIATDQPQKLRNYALIDSDIDRQSRAGDQSDIGRLTDSFHLNLTAFGLLSFAVGIFIVYGAIGLAFEQRRGMMRTLRALGLPLSTLITLLCFEMTAIAVLAGTLGVAMGYVVAVALLPDVAATLKGLYGADVPGSLTIRPIWWIAGLVIACVGTAIASTAALVKVARMPLLASAQNRSWSISSGLTTLWLACLGVLLWFVVLVIFQIGTGLIVGFVLLGGLLIGAAFVLPFILNGILSFAQHLSKSAVMGWFWADTRQQLSGLSLALMALMLAMATNIGVSTMVSSFRQTFVGWLDQRLASELYVYVDTQDQAEFIKGMDVDAVLPIISQKQVVFGDEIEIFGVKDHDTYRDNWTMLSETGNVWDALQRGDSIVVNEQFARRYELQLGQNFPVAGRDFVVQGIYSDYGNPIGQAYISYDAFIRLFPDTKAIRFALRMDPNDIDHVSKHLVKNHGIPPDNIVNQKELKALSLGVFEQTFTVTTALNYLTLAVAGFAILMSLLTLAAMRLPQLAPIWAMGLTRATLGRYELIRAVILAGITALLAIPLGLALSWVLLAVVNVEAFGWKLPMFIYPWEYSKLILLALFAACVAALWPALRLSKTPPSDLLKVFSNER